MYSKVRNFWHFLKRDRHSQLQSETLNRDTLEIKYLYLVNGFWGVQVHESFEVLAEKVNVALKHNVVPIFCCGEVLPEREAGKHFEVIEKQLEESLFHLKKGDFANVVIAYEPVWAIGTGVTASPEQAQEMHHFIRGLVAQKYDIETAENTTILYGGSCNSKNAKELFANVDVDGGLIGGAALKPHEFIKIIQSF